MARRWIGALSVLVGLVLSAHAAPVHATSVAFGPTPYLCFDTTQTTPEQTPFSGVCGASESPFAPIVRAAGFSYFHLETFEDHLLNTPGVSASPAPPSAGVTSVVFGPSIHDSVDADDGAIDGSGLRGDSFFAGNGSGGITFSFSASVLGSLPTHAGIVWTDGGGTITFSASGPGGTLAACTQSNVSGPGFPDASNNGETAEDRFFGCSDPGGISSIFISNSSGGIEVDHLQYGLVGATGPVPEPGTLTLFAIGIGALAWIRRTTR